MKACADKEPYETKKGAGPCDIRYDVLKRNGKPNYWCHTHGMDASAPDGNPVESCPGRWFERVPPESQLDVDLAHQYVAIWGALEPGIMIGTRHPEPGKVHVHVRGATDGPKVLDQSYDIVRLHGPAATLVVDGKPAVAYSVSELAGQTVVPLECPRCHEVHTDELKFATHPHHKHLCNGCGRNFMDSAGQSISNPVADAHRTLGLDPAQAPIPAAATLTLSKADYEAIMIWPSNTAIVSTMARPEEIGIHVHAWDLAGRVAFDETYGSVVLDGEALDLDSLKLLTVQRAVGQAPIIETRACDHCGAVLSGRSDSWVEPSTSHQCQACGGITKTRRKMFVNPLASKAQ